MIIWFFILVVQAMAFTWVSRARNSGNIAYHSFAAVFSNGVFFISQLYLISHAAKPDMPLSTLIGIGSVYVAGTTIGATLMHWISLKYLETGNRKVGSNCG